MKLLLLALLLVQDSETIPKAHKRAYIRAADDCKKAEALLTSDPKEAIRLLTDILESSSVEERECRLRIEMRSGSYSKWYDFFPYQFRGRAYQALAKKSTDTTEKITFLEKAQKDLAESISRNLPSSKTYHATLQTELTTLRNEQLTLEKEPPFRRAWRTLIDDGRFAAAKSHVETKGTFLPGEKREAYLSDTEKECQEALKAATLSFYRALRDHPEAESLTRLNSSEYNRRFQLPAKADQITSSFGYRWCRSVLSTLDRLRRGEDILKPLLAHGVEATPLKAPLVFLEPLAWSVALNQVTTLTNQATNALEKERLALKEKANQIQTTWKEFETKVEASPMRGKLPIRNFESLFARFPVEWKNSPATLLSLEEALASSEPMSALSAVEKTLVEENSRGKSFTIESRQTILRLQITAGALRILAGYESVEKAVEELAPLGDKWKELGGSNTTSTFGPRVEEILQNLLR